jgi:L-lactate utilization protein LutB
MSESDYRAIISTAMEERAQKETLQRILKEERASFDVIIAEAKTLDEARKEERERSAAALAEKDKRISQLEGTIKKLRRSVWFPGVIGGVTADNGGKLEGAIGFGWKLSIF